MDSIWMVIRYNKNIVSDPVIRLFYDKAVAFEFVKRDNARFSSVLDNDFDKDGLIGYSGSGWKYVYHVNLTPIYETHNSIKKPTLAEPKILYPFWTSWWTSIYPYEEYEDDTTVNFPAKIWVSGQKGALDEDKEMYSLCALIKAHSEQEVWKIVSKGFPDYEERFCTQKDLDFQENDLGDRFK